MAKWELEPEHSVAAFKARHMMVSWVRGQFNNLTGTLIFDPENVVAASVQVAIDATSVYTGLEKRDNHLKSEDFLHVEKFPTITFRSTRVEPAGLDHALLRGELTLRGITRPVLLDTRWTGPSHFDDEGTIYTSFGFEAKTVINREDFGMTFNMEMEHGGFMVGKHIHLTLNAEVNLVEE